MFRFVLASRNGGNRWHVRQTIRLLRYYRSAIDRLERENVLNLLGQMSMRIS